MSLIAGKKRERAYSDSPLIKRSNTPLGETSQRSDDIDDIKSRHDDYQ